MKKKRKTSRFKIEKERKISEESAIEEVKIFCKRYDLDAEPVDGEINETLESTLEIITEYVSLGYLEFDNENFSITQHLQYPPGDVSKVIYKRITGKLKRVMDGYEDNENNGKIQALMGSSSGLGIEGIEKLQGVDLKVMEALGMAFLL